MNTLLLLTLLFIPAQQPEQPETFICVVKAPNRVECPIPKSTNWPGIGGTMTFKDLNWNIEPYSEWTWQVQYRGGEADLNQTMIRVRPKVGQKLRATFRNGILVPLLGCEETVHRKVNDYSRNHPGDRFPYTLLEKPKDCRGGR